MWCRVHCLSVSSSPHIWHSGDLWLDLGWVHYCWDQEMCCLLLTSITKLQTYRNVFLALFLPSPRPVEACLYICLFLFCFFMWRVKCTYKCLCVCVPLLTLLVCRNTSVSRPTSNQWCQPFDACRSVTWPYCAQRHPKRALLSLTRQCFHLTFLSHKSFRFFG